MPSDAPLVPPDVARVPPAPPAPRRGARRIALRLALSLATLFVAFVVVDRIYAALLPVHMFGWFRQVPDDDVFYEPVPSIRYELMGSTYAHNALRMRDGRERSTAGDGRRRIAFLGDSVCYGSRVDDAQAMSAVAERELAASASGGGAARGAECLNFGVPGYNTHQIRHATEARFGEFEGITDAVYVISENDIVNACFEPATHRLPWVLYSRYQPPGPAWRFWLRRSAILSVVRARTSGYSARHQERVERLQARGVQTEPAPQAPGVPAPSPDSAAAPAAYDATTSVLRSLILEDTELRGRFEGLVRELSDLCRARGVRFVAVYVPSEQTLRLDRDRTYAHALGRICTAAGAEFADGTDALDGAGPCHADNGHPDAHGHELVGRMIARLLAPR